MAAIQVNNLHFTYEGSAEKVFDGLSFNMDSSWRLGLVGRNGRGKTTLLKLLAGELTGQGEIWSGLPFDFFPFPIAPDRPAGEGLLDALAPYAAWEREMAALLKDGGAEALRRFGELEHRYAAEEGYTIRELLKRESSLAGIDPDELGRHFSTFSPGEQTRLMLAALFLRGGRFSLIDEPTNHLDMEARQKTAEYLSRKSGFLAVSHDRDFLDRVCDHILALEKQGARVCTGNYSVYRENKRLRDEHERTEHERLSADISRLRDSAMEKAAWSDRIEAGKIGQHAADRGYIGHKSARMMKRAKTIEGRVRKGIKEKEALLKNLEYEGKLNLTPLIHPSRTLLRLEQVSFSYGEKPLIQGLNMSLSRGERLAITGPNGAGKTTLLKLMGGALMPQSGTVWRANGLIVSWLSQTSKGLSGTPRELAQRCGLGLTLFLTLLRKLDLPRESFDRDAAGFSLGQKKKLMLSLSLAQPAHLYLWDEPLNDIDPESREAIEALLLGTDAAMAFVEHERTFLDRVATREMRVMAG